jgi:hypothetical protein
VLHGSGNPRFRDDDGSADPAVAAALAAFAAAEGSEHAALTALSGARFLVPVVAVLSDDDTAEPGPATGGEQAGPATGGEKAGGAAGGEKNSEMAMPTLLGRDGRAAIPVFTGLDALTRWQPAARPVPAEAIVVWQAAAQDSCAVIIDVAGPVPLAVEGARLTALAKGEPVPLPHEDPDVHEVVAAIMADAEANAGSASAGSAGVPSASAGLAGVPSASAGSAAGASWSFALRLAPGDADLLIELAPPAGLDPAAIQAFAAQVGSAVLERLGFRLRRGIALALAQP